MLTKFYKTIAGLLQDEVDSRVKEEFDKAGIEFAFPSRTIYVKD